MIDSGFVAEPCDQFSRASAHAVFICWRFLFAPAFAGQSGVAHAIKQLTREIDRDMAMLGVCKIDDIGREMLCSANAM